MIEFLTTNMHTFLSFLILLDKKHVGRTYWFFIIILIYFQIAFQVLVKALIGLDPGEEMEFLMLQFQKFIAGLMSLPIKLPGTQLHRSLQAKKKMVKLVLEIIRDKRINDFDVPRDSKDVVDVLLNDKSNKFTYALISDNMIDLMIPGEDSVPLLITLAIKYLSDCPKALHQLKVLTSLVRLTISSTWHYLDKVIDTTRISCHFC